METLNNASVYLDLDMSILQKIAEIEAEVCKDPFFYLRNQSDFDISYY